MCPEPLVDDFQVILAINPTFFRCFTVFYKIDLPFGQESIAISVGKNRQWCKSVVLLKICSMYCFFMVSRVKAFPLVLS